MKTERGERCATRRAGGSNGDDGVDDDDDGDDSAAVVGVSADDWRGWMSWAR